MQNPTQISSEQLKELLVKPGFVSEADFERTVTESEKSKTSLIEALLTHDLIKDEQLGQLIAESLGFQFINLRKEKIDDAIFHMVPELVARSRGVIAFARDADGVKVGLLNPNDIEMIHFLEKRTGERIIPFMITDRDLQEELGKYKGSMSDAFVDIFSKLKSDTITREERDGITIAMVDTLLQYGYRNKASDIHIEPTRHELHVRFRIDGVMHDVLQFPKDVAESILTRIKILSGMRTDEHRAAQDGKLQFDVKEEMVDVRVSIVPVVNGENVVLRLLSAKSRQFSLADLGLGDTDLKIINCAMKNPHGMILVTGPTGSGKTTTVYAILKILNTREVHIATIEDPVEYDIEGVSQIQVNIRTELTFAKGLRAIVRQDPDIIMVGEIRDEETAGIAVNSAMTGHLVLSTLHANDAATTLPRLLDMHIEPFLVASTVNVIIAQRLVRKICERCRSSYEPDTREKNTLKDDQRIKDALAVLHKGTMDSLRLYRGSGCDVCAHTGYTGRIGIFEVLEMTDEMRSLITARASSSDIMKVARRAGMTTMLEDGVSKVLQGSTTLDEVLRVTKE
ncbi:MAG: ATPase, T2SS/T4P/T4SS family [Patescibacteria group bacterium]